MRIVIGSDHAGFQLKSELRRYLESLELEILDVGAFDEEPSDYPDFAEKLGVAVVGIKDSRGILICGSGVGASIAANKIPGIRAALCHDTYSAHQGVEHDDMNVLVLGSRIIGLKLAEELVAAFIKAKFIDKQRYRRRLDKALRLERKYSKEIVAE